MPFNRASNKIKEVRTHRASLWEAQPAVGRVTNLECQKIADRLVDRHGEKGIAPIETRHERAPGKRLCQVNQTRHSKRHSSQVIIDLTAIKDDATHINTIADLRHREDWLDNAGGKVRRGDRLNDTKAKQFLELSGDWGKVFVGGRDRRCAAGAPLQEPLSGRASVQRASFPVWQFDSKADAEDKRVKPLQLLPLCRAMSIALSKRDIPQLIISTKFSLDQLCSLPCHMFLRLRQARVPLSHTFGRS